MASKKHVIILLHLPGLEEGLLAGLLQVSVEPVFGLDDVADPALALHLLQPARTTVVVFHYLGLDERSLHVLMGCFQSHMRLIFYFGIIFIVPLHYLAVRH